MAQNLHKSRGGRPRKVTPEDALDLAEAAFWNRGLDGTSLDDLSRATALKRPSLAATFGSKRDLYLAALRKRVDRNAVGLQTLLQAPGSLAEVLSSTFLGALDQHLAGSPSSRGCFVISTALGPARDDAEVAEVLRNSLLRTEDLFRSRIEAAGLDEAEVRGATAAATLHNLAIRARGGEDADRLRDYARSAACWIARP